MLVDRKIRDCEQHVVWPSFTKTRAITVIIFTALLVSPITSNYDCKASGPIPVAIQPRLQDNQEPAAEEKTEAEKLTELQGQVAESYQLLEQKLFTLQEYERDNNPMRSKLLQRAFVQSQERMTAAQLAQIVSMLKQKNLRDAEQRQVTVLKELESLLQLLESEDRGTRVRDDIRRYQEYLKEIERLGRVQRSIRVQTENNGDNQRIANSQEKTANRTERLAREIRRNEEANAEEPGQPGDSDSSENASRDQASDGSAPNRDNDTDGEKPNGDSNQSKDEQSSNNSEEKDGRKKEGEDAQNSDQAPSDSGDPKKPGDGQGKGTGKPNKGGEGQPGEQGGEQGQPGSGASRPQDEEGNPVRKRLDQAEQKMREAQQKLEQAKRGDSVEAMREAEREIALAKKELEEILRQLREEEVDRVLAMLEGRFRRMLEREVRVYESTRKLEQIAPQDRDAEFEIRSGKLGQVQNAIATEASRALLLLKEDGSSVAFPETVDQMREDMLQVAERLGAAKIGKITLEIEEDIIDTLDYLIEALVKTQQDMAAMKQNQKQNQQQGGMPGDQPLVDQLAEIKMMRGLQERIYKRHRRYSRLLDDPDDAVGATNDPDLRRALQRLAVRQRQLTDIARDIVNGKNQ